MEVFHGIRVPVGQWILFQPAPDIFHGIQFRSIGRKEGARQALRGADKLLNGPGPVDGEVVPDHDEGSTEFDFQLFEEGPGFFGIHVVVGEQLEAQEDRVGDRSPTEGGDDRHFRMGASALIKQRRVAPRAPGAAHQGSHQESGFVEEGDPGPGISGFFLRAGQSFLTHPSIRSSFRTLARRSGFWGVHPREWRRRPT